MKQLNSTDDSAVLTHKTPVLTAEAASGAPQVYNVGSLQYTKMGLAAVFLWLLWGDFCFNLMEQLIPNVLPLKLKSLGADNGTIGMLTGTLALVMNMFITPIVSFKSDRFRSKWGRRIPFLLFPTPFVAAFLFLIGYTDEIGAFFYNILGSHFGASPLQVTLIMLGIMLVCFQLAHMFVGSVYYYLFNDVVPKELLARFMSMFRVVATGSGAAFSALALPYSQTHMKWIFLACGAIYFLGYMLMCLRVKEGSYPAPPQYVGGRQNVWGGIKTFVKESYFSRFYYWKFYLANTFSTALISVLVPYNLIFATSSLGLNLSQVGWMTACGLVASLILLYPAGVLADHFHPLPMLIIKSSINLLVLPLGLIYLFTDYAPDVNYKIQWVLMVITLPISVLYQACELPMFMKLMPHDRYGQFSAANAMFRALALAIMIYGTGKLLDQIKLLYPENPDFSYRYLPILSIVFQIVNLVFLVLLYRDFKKFGGKKNYSPPPI